MKKIFLAFFAIGTLALAGCTSNSTNPPANTNPTSIEKTTFSTYTHTQYTVDYPSKLAPVANGDSYVSFNNNSGTTEMGIRIREGESKGYLDAETAGQVTFKDGQGTLYINKTGYCDGPGCGPAFIAYSLYNGKNTYIVEFFNQTEETEASRQVLKSFSLR